MKASKLRGTPVVSIAAGVKIGAIEDLVISPNRHIVTGIRIKMARSGVLRTVGTDAVRLGKNAVTVRDADAVAEREAVQEDGTVDLSKLKGTRVLTHGGDLLGKVSDVEFDPSTFRIEGYELAESRLGALIGATRLLPAVKGIHYGADLLMVPDHVRVESEKRRAA